MNNLDNNKIFHIQKDSLDFRESHIHKFINHNIIGGEMLSYPTYLDQYKSGSMEMHIHMGWDAINGVIGENNRNYCIILKTIGEITNINAIQQANTTIQGNSIDREFPSGITTTASDGTKLTVLVSIFETAHYSQDIHNRITKIIKLRSYDDCPSLRVHTSKGFVKFIPKGIIDHELTTLILEKDVFGANWETNVIPILFRNASDDDIIKCTSQVMYEITEYDGNHGIRLLSDLETIPDLIFAIRIDDTGEIVRIAACIHDGSEINVFHVLFSPPELEPPIIHRMLYYNNGEENGKEETKDSEGTRNTCSNSRGFREEPEEGSSSRQPANQQPEEVGYQTSLDHHHDGCIAKNTHSGSLEDA